MISILKPMSVTNNVISAPVSIHDVNSVLGHGSTDLGTLCQSGKINKWSFHKPVDKNQLTVLNDNDYFSVDDGFAIPRFNSARDAWSALANGSVEWVYNKPSSYFRLTDFNGYDHNAEAWFNLSIVGPSSVELGSSVHFNMNTDVGWLVNNFYTFKQYINLSGGVLDFGFLLRDVSSSGDGVYYYKRCDVLDISTDGKGLFIKLPSTTNELNTGTYKIVPVLTTDTNHAADSISYPSKDETAYLWFVLPCTPITVYIDKSGSSDLSYINVEYVSGEFDKAGYFISISSLVLSFTNSSNGSLSPQYTVTLTDSVNQSVLKSDMVTIPGNNSVEVDLIGKDGSYNYESATGLISIEVAVRIGSSVKYWDFRINSDKE